MLGVDDPLSQGESGCVISGSQVGGEGSSFIARKSAAYVDGVGAEVGAEGEGEAVEEEGRAP